MESKINSRSQCSLTKYVQDHGKAEFIKNKSGHMCAIFPDGNVVFVSKKASEQMLAGDKNKDNYQYSEIQCADGSWCPTISPRYTANILFTIE